MGNGDQGLMSKQTERASAEAMEDELLCSVLALTK